MHLFSTLLAIVSLGLWSGSVVAAPGSPLVQRLTDNGVETSMASTLYHTDKAPQPLTIHDSVYGTRKVSYWTTSDGQAVIDGDILYGPVQDLLSAQVGHGNQAMPRGFALGDIQWPNATIRYRYRSDQAEKRLKFQVEEGIKRWLEGAPYLKFKQELPNGAPAVGEEEGVLKITDDCDGGFYVARGFANKFLRMNLASPECTGDIPMKGTVHELGHVLGLLHEHQRPDREATIHYACENVTHGDGCVMPPGKTCCDEELPENCCAWTAQFETLTGPNDYGGSYDIESVMHYPLNSCAIPGKDTMIMIQPDMPKPGQRDRPSNGDLMQVCNIYKEICWPLTKGIENFSRL